MTENSRNPGTSFDTEPDYDLYHRHSTNPSRKSGLDNQYNRSVSDYELELDFKFNLNDWIGKRLLDIGSGAYERFGRQARKKGVDAISLNPALDDLRSWALLEEGYEYDTHEASLNRNFERRRLPLWKKPFYKGVKIARPQEKNVRGLAQDLPFDSESFDCVVSVYGVPHYLHHVDPSITNDRYILEAYTSEVRERDKQLIRQVFNEIIRVLKPGGKVYLTDDYRAPDQTVRINTNTPSDGTEVIEVLDELREQGIEVEVYASKKKRLFDEVPSDHIGIKRIIILTKPTTAKQ